MGGHPTSGPEDLLRDVFADLAGEAPVPDRAGTALPAARVRRRAAVLVAAVVLVVAGALVVPHALDRAPTRAT